VEKPGDEGEYLLETPQANEHHRFDGFTHGEDPHFRLLHGSADDVTIAELAEHASHKAEGVQRVAAGKGGGQI
jgi:hypothetical protein